ncbi:hypothetical protein [Pseudomonas sp. YJ42]|uniref:hypothetical protein n=1 Tax=Pseudomonas sp. YJ42 TaxID=3392115 RepID=UPI0039A0E702
MANQEQHADFFWRVYLPIALLAVVIFGFPWLAMKISQHRDGAKPDSVPAKTTNTEAEQVQGRAPGLSEHASPFGKTEARAERILDPAGTEKPSLVSVGQLLRPALPSPRRQEWDDKGKALGVNQLTGNRNAKF